MDVAELGLPLGSVAAVSGMQLFWFCAIALLWSGYLLLEGFDFGVGILLPFAARDELDRLDMLEAIGPSWDANEVWMITAVAASLAAFPLWYATLLTGFYLYLLVILLGLAARGLGLSLREQRRSVRWRTGWDWAITSASFAVPLLWGLVFANVLHGVPIGTAGSWTLGAWYLLKPYALLGGLSLLALVTLHGATFLTLRCDGELRVRVGHIARWLSLPVLLTSSAFLAWTATDAQRAGHLGPASATAMLLVPLAVAAAAWLLRYGQEAWAFAATALAMLAYAGSIFSTLYPRLLVSSNGEAFDLTVVNAATADHSLKAMAVVALLFTPVLALAQLWSYRVFAARRGARRAADHEAGAELDGR